MSCQRRVGHHNVSPESVVFFAVASGDREVALSRESIIAEIRKDIALMEGVIKLLGGGKMVSIDEVVGKTKKARRKISAAGRRRIATAQRARWAKIKAAKKK